MSAPEDQISDNELLDIIEKVLCNEFSENDENQMLNILTNRFPNIVNLGQRKAQRLNHESKLNQARFLPMPVTPHAPISGMRRYQKTSLSKFM